MSGKAYTMQEMRRIVEYLTEHRAYRQIKGRKIWMDYASSKLTNRTWQSLKETFLKRILPDIHNPYYKLSSYQIASFREGHDVENRLKNKLQVRETSVETSNGDSTETLVLNNCYESAEDIKRDVSTPTEERENIKTLRDLIEFEPMTPEVQRLIDDFGTDGEGSDGEPRMEIDLEKIGGNNVTAEETPITLSDFDKADTTKSTSDSEFLTHRQPGENKDVLNQQDVQRDEEDISETTSKPRVTTNPEANKNKIIERETEVAPITKNTKIDENNKSKAFNNSDTIASTNSTLPDSILPNNQEELKKDDKTNKSKQLSLNKKGSEAKTVVKRKNIDRSDDNQPKTSRSESVTDTEKLNLNTEPAVIISDSGDTEQTKEFDAGGKDNKKLPQSSENPCLQSVSLYEAQLAETKNSETKSGLDIIQDVGKNEDKASNTKQTPESKKNDVVILKSHSESDTSKTETSDIGPIRPIVTKRNRDNALANVFGFTSGAVRRRNSYRRRSLSRQQTIELNSESSWTSDTDSEYVSPPRGRRTRRTRKYLKPKSARVTSLERNGGLFVVYNNRIYPLVKDGKVVKNHVNYISDGDSDEDRSCWKLKYLEEKKKSAELQKLLRHMQEKNRIELRRASEAAVNSDKCDNIVKSSHAPCHIQETRSTANPVQEAVQEERPVKIKFTKNNEEVQLEGPLSHITPALAHVMQLLQKTELPQKTELLQKTEMPHNTELPQKIEQTTADPVTESRTSSLMAVHLDDEVQEKVNKIEDEIFKEIEEHDKFDSTAAYAPDHVTQRNRLRRKPSTTSARSESPAKKPKVERKEDSSQKRSEQEEGKTSAVETSVQSTRKTRTPRKSIKENVRIEANTSTRRQSRKLAEPKTEDLHQVEEESDIRYKFPSPPHETASRSKKTQNNKLNRYTDGYIY